MVYVFFPEDGKQIKGPDFYWSGDLRRYFDDNSGQLQTNRYLEYKGNWYYLDATGRPLTGEQTINGQEVYFNNDGIQIKGDFSGESYSYPDQTFYYDSNSGARVRKEGLVQNKKAKPSTSRTMVLNLQEYVKLMVTSTISKHVKLPLLLIPASYKRESVFY